MGVRVRKERNKSRSARGTDWKPAGGSPGIALPGGGATHIYPGARSVGSVGQLKRWATVWSAAQPTE